MRPIRFTKGQSHESLPFLAEGLFTILFDFQMYNVGVWLYILNMFFVDKCVSHCMMYYCNSVTRPHDIIALQTKGRWESNMNVWFRLMYSQKWNCAALLFPKQNYNVLSLSFPGHASLSDLYIPRIGLPILRQPIRQTDPWNILLTDTWT